MFTKLIAASVFTASLLTIPGSAQSATELLQKGIYAQQTAGDLDGAIKIFRQIVSSATPAQRAQAAQAQYLLVQSLIRKGDFTVAAQELQKLATDYPDYKDLANSLVASASGAAHAMGAAAAPPCATPDLGTLTGSHYQNKKTAVQFDLPQDWSVPCTVSSGIGEMALLADADLKDATAFAWMTSENIAAGDIHSRLHWDFAEKEGSRRAQFGENYGYRLNSVQDETIGGQQALIAIADYTAADGTKMTEYHTWIYTTKTRAYFAARVAASDLPQFQPVFERIIQSAIIP